MTPVTVFSTAGLPAGQRTERWEAHNAGALIGLRCRNPAVLAGELNRPLDRVHLARVRGAPHAVERDRALIGRRPADAVAIYLGLAGGASFHDADGPRTLRPGQLLMCDADRPFRRGFPRGLEELVVKIPRDVFAAATGRDHVAHAVVAESPFARALGRLVGPATRRAGPVDEALLLDLVSALAGRPGPAAYRSAAQAFVGEHLADPELSAPRVAAAVGISTRHLSRVFAEAGTSVPRYVLGQRLERARSLLAEGAGSVAEIARSCGFTSPAHFSTVFRAHFGDRPSDVRTF